MDSAKKILIVEDDERLLVILADKFSSEEFEVLTARDGEQALATIWNEWPDIILLDIIMPNMDGMAVLKELQANEKGRKIPVIVLTNVGDSEQLYEAVHNDICDYLIKAHWSIEDIVRKVKQRLRASRLDLQ